jgi:1,4-alpha-glucan branching enzyme
MLLAPSVLSELIEGRCGDPFAVLGLHAQGDRSLLRVWAPAAREVIARPAGGAPLTVPAVHPAGLFELVCDLVPGSSYAITIDRPGGRDELACDPYSCDLVLSDWDLARFAEGRHHDLWTVLGSHPREQDGVAGVRFAVWAPNARAVAVAGDWNGFSNTAHPMRRRHPFGVWEIFLPGLRPGLRYKYAIAGADGHTELKADPLAFQAEIPPATASVIAPEPAWRWRDDAWMERRLTSGWRHAPMSIYEVHLGSWRRDADGHALSYRDLAAPLIEHCRNCGFTHVEFLPLVAHPYEGSWGYQASGWYAPNSRHGGPDDLRHLIDALHGAGISVIVDVVPGHFPKDAFGLARFDGSPCYEYGDPREGEHREWGTLVFNYRRPEVRNFLLASFLFWLEHYHIDGLRVDAVSAMLYRNYNRAPGEWIANAEGGNANLEAVSFLQEMNRLVHDRFPGVCTIAEESTAWQGTTAPVEWRGLGFDLKWNMGWMHDTLRYLAQDPLLRPGCHDWITFHQWYAYDECWVLPLSHDEVVHGKGSLIDKLHGDYSQRLATLRQLLGYQVAVPGRPLLFMGGEIGQGREWAWQGQVAWDEGLMPERAGICRFLAAALALYRTEPALHVADDRRDGFLWVDVENRTESIHGFLRRAPGARDILVVCNFTPVVRPRYPIGVTSAGRWELLLNSDDERFGGTGYGVSHSTTISGEQLGSWPAMLRLDLPANGIVFLAAPRT